MQTIRSEAGSAAWYCQLSRSVNVEPPRERFEEIMPRCEQKTIQTMIGDISVEQLDRGVDVDALVHEIWSRLDTDGNMLLMIIMPDMLTVTISASRDLNVVEIISVDYDAEGSPAGLCGCWVE